MILPGRYTCPDRPDIDGVIMTIWSVDFDSVEYCVRYRWGASSPAPGEEGVGVSYEAMYSHFEREGYVEI